MRNVSLIGKSFFRKHGKVQKAHSPCQIMVINPHNGNTEKQQFYILKYIYTYCTSSSNFQVAAAPLLS